jgi:hypothetical protein
MSRNLRGRLDRLEEQRGSPEPADEEVYVFDWAAMLRGDVPAPRPGQRIDCNWDGLIKLRGRSPG